MTIFKNYANQPQYDTITNIIFLVPVMDLASYITFVWLLPSTRILTCIFKLLVLAECVQYTTVLCGCGLTLLLTWTCALNHNIVRTVHPGYHIYRVSFFWHSITIWEICTTRIRSALWLFIFNFWLSLSEYDNFVVHISHLLC